MSAFMRGPCPLARPPHGPSDFARPRGFARRHCALTRLDESDLLGGANLPERDGVRHEVVDVPLILDGAEKTANEVSGKGCLQGYAQVIIILVSSPRRASGRRMGIP